MKNVTAFAALAGIIGLAGCQGHPHAHTHAEGGQQMPAVLVAADEGTPLGFPLHPSRSLAGAETNAAGMNFYEESLPARSAGAPPHTHTHEDEFFYVRKGQVTFLSDGVRRTLGPGGFALLPRGTLHAFWNEADEDAILLIGASEGQFDGFFDAVAMDIRAENAATPQAVGAIVARIGAERGIIIDMSALPPDVAALYGGPPP